MKPPPQRWRIAAFVIALSVFSAGLAVIRFFMPYTVDGELAAARAQGIPTSYAEIPRPSCPPEQDAAADYARMAEDPSGHSFSEHERYILTHPMSPKLISDAEARTLGSLLVYHYSYFVALHHVASKPHLTIDWVHAPPAVISKQISGVREAAQRLRGESGTLLCNGRKLEAAQAAGSIYNLAQQVYEQPGLVSLSVGSRIESLASDGLKAILADSPPDSALARVVRDAAGANLDVPDLHRALMGEIASMRPFWPRYIAGSDELSPISFTERMQRKAYVAAGIHWTIRMIRAAETPEPHRLKALQALLDELPTSGIRSPAVEPARGMADLGPKSEKMCLHRCAERRTLYAAACVLDYRARMHRFPARLEDAVNPVPVDPFDGKPLFYTRTARGFSLVATTADAQWKPTGPVSRQDQMRFTYPSP